MKINLQISLIVNYGMKKFCLLIRTVVVYISHFLHLDDQGEQSFRVTILSIYYSFPIIP